MDYIKQIDAFNTLYMGIIHPTPRAFYYISLDINRQLGWPREFHISNEVLQAMLNMPSRSAFIKCRDELIRLGLITYTPGTKGRPSTYSIKILYDVDNQNQPVFGLDKGLIQSLLRLNPDQLAQIQSIFSPNRDRIETETIENDKIQSVFGLNKDQIETENAEKVKIQSVFGLNVDCIETENAKKDKIQSVFGLNVDQREPETPDNELAENTVAAQDSAEFFEKSALPIAQATEQLAKEERSKEENNINNINNIYIYKYNNNLTQDIELDNRIGGMGGREETIAKPPPQKKRKPPERKLYGFYQNVPFLEKELSTLKEILPDEWEEWIEKVSDYFENNPKKKCVSGLATIRNWRRMDKERERERKERGHDYGARRNWNSYQPNGLLWGDEIPEEATNFDLALQKATGYRAVGSTAKERAYGT